MYYRLHAVNIYDQTRTGWQCTLRNAVGDSETRSFVRPILYRAARYIIALSVWVTVSKYHFLSCVNMPMQCMQSANLSVCHRNESSNSLRRLVEAWIAFWGLITTVTKFQGNLPQRGR